jgi:hypothetical protein
LQYSKPNLPRNPHWEGYGKTTKNIFGVGRDQRLARQISWTLPGGFGQTAISVSIRRNQQTVVGACDDDLFKRCHFPAQRAGAWRE